MRSKLNRNTVSSNKNLFLAVILNLPSYGGCFGYTRCNLYSLAKVISGDTI